MGKAATLKLGDTLKFGAGERRLTVISIDYRRKTVKVHAEGPDYITVTREAPHEVDSDETTK